MSALTRTHQNDLRKYSAALASNALGTVISSLLSFLMPWMLGSAALNIVKLVKNIWKLITLKGVLKKLGLEVPKRHILKGICQGFATKLCTTVLTLGHDDFLEPCKWIGSFLVGKATWISSTLRGELSAVKCVEEIRYGNPLIKKSTNIAGWPVEKFQKRLGWDEAEGVTESGHGWHAGSRQVAGQVFGTGSLVIATESVLDQTLDKPIGKAITYFDRTAHEKNTNQALAALEVNRPRVVCNMCGRPDVGNSVHYHCQMCTLCPSGAGYYTGLGFDLCVTCHNSSGGIYLHSHKLVKRILEPEDKYEAQAICECSACGISVMQGSMSYACKLCVETPRQRGHVDLCRSCYTQGWRCRNSSHTMFSRVLNSPYEYS
jgi:hypothetical protein